MKHSIELNIRHTEKIDMLNLYFIIKSFTCNIIYLSVSLIIVIEGKHKQEFIAHNIGVTVFKHMSYPVFVEWFYGQINEDWKYLNESSKYSFHFTYPIDLFDRNLIEYLRPVYPWNPEILESVGTPKKDKPTDYSKFTKKIKYLNNIIRKLQFSNKQKHVFFRKLKPIHIDKRNDNTTLR